MTKSQKERISNIILFVVLTLGAILILFPIAWMICTALKSAPEIAMYPPKLLPEKPMFENFIIAWQKAPFTKYTINTLIIVFFTIIGNVFVNSFVSYGFAKVDFAGKNILFTCILATMMIPGFITLVPTYVIFSKLHWVNTYLPLIVPAFFGNAFHIFMMRQFYMTIPIELTEAARIDGAGHFYIWGKLMMPLVKPVMATIALIAFKGAWSDFQGPLLYLSDRNMYTLQLGLQVFKGQGFTEWNYLMAVSFLSMIPILILFFCFQNYFIEGMNVGGAVK
ncbi:MAG TPA: carbohydrate ABC transporter permease [Candidatus Eisenbergiella merdigallinarum]|uniref:Carbohydrate ABC transporter permease n=1 Tax=Candidatus Eisenbergiella merdigallinarum TaxID=2838552 RepID=A0A9D2MPJ7_9FIRM|nr:carbohydrate ABC transporter permease [Candidatus Eisenbergiella merdigallinarum]